MRCFERLLTDIEDDRNGHSENLASARNYIRTAVPDVEIRNLVSPASTAYYEYTIDHIEGEYVRPPLETSLRITLPVIQTIVHEAARTEDPRQSLGRLRRQLAWRLHPDRRLNHEPDGLLARANACIDQALEQIKI